EGAAAALGAPIARLSIEGAAPATSPPDETPASPPPVAVVERPPRPVGGRPRATPVARRVAEELGVDLAQINGTGPGGRIVEGDVRAAMSSTATAGPGHVMTGKGEG